MDSDLDAARRFIRIPKVPLERRIGAFAIDFGAASLFSIVGGGALYIPFFIITWYALRVVLVARNRGQSLGRWALDMKVIDPKYRSIPGLLELFKRESITGLGCLLLLIGIANLSPANAWILVTPVPVLADCGFAFADEEYRQAFHDRIARTVVAQTRRGYSLDIKLKKLFADIQDRVK